MGLTWNQFLKLASVITNLKKPIYDIDKKRIRSKEKNRRVATAAKDYLELFEDLKYMHFMDEVRISFKNLIIILQVIEIIVDQ